MSQENSTNRNDKVKNSIVLSGLVGTAGLFVAKLLGLLYSMPLSSILGSDALMSYYGTSYRLYAYTLNVFTAGIPFAISTIVAKYTVLNDNKSLIRIKHISTKLLRLLGLMGMILMIFMAGLIAPLVTQGDDPSIMRNCLMILSAAIFFVPVLAAYRGFWQGRKEMQEYAFSQAFEQLIRVGFLLSVAFVLVYVLHMERTAALYAAVVSTSVAAIAAIIQFHIFDQKHIGEIEEGRRIQKSKGVSQEKILHELIMLAIPFLISAMIGYADDIFNSTLLPIGLRVHGYSGNEINTIISGVNYVGNKLTSIPQILAPGFVTALIPHITGAITEENHEKVSSITAQCISIVLFIATVVSACIAIYATDIFNVLFYSGNPELSASVVRWMALEGFFGTICPVTSSLMIALGLKRSIIKRQMIVAVIKAGTMVPLIWLLGYRGAVISSMLGSVFLLTSNLREMDSKFSIRLGTIVRNAFRILLSLAIMFGVSVLLRMIGISSTGHVGKLLMLILTAVNVLISMTVYFGAADLMHVSKELFNHNSVFSVITARFRKS